MAEANIDLRVVRQMLAIGDDGPPYAVVSPGGSVQIGAQSRAEQEVHTDARVTPQIGDATRSGDICCS